MPLGTREVLLVLRAKDEVSRTLGEIGRGFGALDRDAQQAAQAQMATGKALMGIGAAVGGIGAAGIAFFADATSAARNFNKEAALTLTQVDQVGVTIEDLKDIAKGVAATIPAPFEQLQSSLFDIFSSMDVNLKEAQSLLEQFARAAVAGNTDVQTAGRASIAVMNGFGYGAGEVNRVMDVQFQLVRKGVGTYEEFATAIGRAIPSAARAGQEVETLAGMMAFLTRNGLSAAMAATSSARALDAFSNPIVVGRLEEMGVKIRDARGEFLPLVDVIGSLKAKLGDLTGPEQAEAIQALFKGAGGTIQARRFIDPALRLFDEFKQRVGEMGASAGAMDAAYDIMFEQPQNQIQLLKNNLMILKTEIGDALAPSVGALVKAGLSLVQWFNDLSPSVKQAIVWVGAAVSAFLLIGGTITFLVGAWLALSAAAVMAGTTMGAVLAPIALIAAGIIALIVVIVLIIKHWDTLKQWALAAWHAIQDAAKSVIDFLQPYWEMFWNALTSAASAGWAVLQAIWRGMQAVFENVLLPAIQAYIKVWQWVWGVVVDAVKLASKGLRNAFGYIAGFFDTIILPALDLLRSAWENVWNNATGVLTAFWSLTQPILQFLIDIIANTLGQALNHLLTVFQQTFNIIALVVMNLWDAVFRPVFTTMITFVMDGVFPMLFALGKIFVNTFEAIANIVGWVFEKIIMPYIGRWVAYIADVVIPGIKLLGEIFGVIFGVIVEVVKLWWDVTSAIFMAYLTILQTALMPILWVLKETFERVWSFIKWIIEQVWNSTINPILQLFVSTIRGVVLPAIDFLSWVWREAWERMASLITWVWRSVIQPVWDGIRWAINNVVAPAINWLADTWNAVMGGIADTTKSIWEGIRDTIVTVINGILGFVEGFVNGIIDGVNFGINALNKLPGPDLIKEIDKITLPRLDAATKARQQVAQAYAPPGGGPVKALQLGGMAYRNMPHWVGETGRELFIPQTTGLVVPESRVGGVTIAEGAVSITIQGSVDASLVPVIRSEVEGAIRRVVQELSVRSR